MTVDTGIADRIDALHEMTVKELRRRWAEVFSEGAPNGHKQYLIKRLAWRIQANAEGDISERAGGQGYRATGQRTHVHRLSSL